MPPASQAHGPVLEQPSRVSVVRQVAIILALWCGVVMVGLLAAWLLHPPGEASAERYVPANKKTALNLLFGAIRSIDGLAPAPLDAKAWAALLPVCVQNPPHGLRGQSVFDALVEQAAALDLRLEQLSLAGAVDADGTPASAPLAKRYRLDPAAWAAQVQAQGQRCQHALPILHREKPVPRPMIPRRELSIRRHLPRQQPALQRGVADHAYVVRPAERQNFRLDLPLDQAIRRL